MTRRLFPALITAAAAAFLGAATPAFSQSELPSELVRAGSLSADQAAAIQQFVTREVAGLKGEDPTALVRSRSNLLRPLRPETSVPFRLKYAEVLAPELRALSASENELKVVNALRIAGELATEQGAELLNSYRGDERSAVRYAAVSGLVRTFASLETGNPALAPERLRPLIDGLGEQLATETHPQVLDAVVRALIEASRLSKQGFAGYRPVAITVLANGAGERLRKLGGEAADRDLLPALLRAGQAVRDVFVVNNPPLDGTRDADLIKAMGALGGDMLAYVHRRHKAGDYPFSADDSDGERQMKAEVRAVPAQIVNVGEAIVIFSITRTDPRATAQSKNLDQHFRQLTNVGDAQLLEGIAGWVGPQGQLTRAFGFAPDRFVTP